MKLFWVYSVMWNFGSWKTFGTFLEVSKLDKTKNFIIANVPYGFVDLFYSLPDELYKIIDSLEKWIYKTNEDVENYFYRMKDYKNIVLIVDEAHLYFNSRRRDRGGLIDRLDVILTQCRKRNIKIYFISQRLKRVDLNIRRMTDYVIRYKRQWIPILWIQRSFRTLYENAWDIADIQGDEWKTYVMNWEGWTKSDVEKSVIESDMFRPMLKVFRMPIWKRISSRDLENFKGEAHNSYFISWLPTERTQTSIDENALFVEEKAFTERELKIRYWINKNLPTFKRLLGYKKIDNEWYNGGKSIASDQRGDTCDLADNGEYSTDKWDLILPEISEQLDEIQDWKRSWTSRRFSDWRDLTGCEDQLHRTDTVWSADTYTSTKIRIKSRT